MRAVIAKQSSIYLSYPSKYSSVNQLTEPRETHFFLVILASPYLVGSFNSTHIAIFQLFCSDSHLGVNKDL